MGMRLVCGYEASVWVCVHSMMIVVPMMNSGHLL